MYALIAGSSLMESALCRDWHVEIVATAFGEVSLRTNGSWLYAARHGWSEKDYVPPHSVNYSAIVTALRTLGAQAVVGLCSVGSLRTYLQPGTFVIPADYWSPWQPTTLQAGAQRLHVAPELDRPLRDRLRETLSATGLHPLVGGTYVQTVGPRFETQAEVRHLATIGELVGMTGASEATLCRECGLPYALLCMVDNHANGVTDTPLSFDAFQMQVRQNTAAVERAVQALVQDWLP